MSFRVLCLLTFAFTATFAIGATIKVPGDQPTIQAGIDAASSGDVVLVAPGTYRERINFLGKAIALISEQGAASTIIDGEQLGTVITMETGEGPGASVQGFTITRGMASFGAGIHLLNASPTIRQNLFLDNMQTAGGYGAAIGGNGASPIVEYNEFRGHTCDSQWHSGVLSFPNSSSPRIHDNLIRDNNCRAITMYLPEDASPLVYNNTIVRNPTAIYLVNPLPNSAQTYRNNLIALNGTGLEMETFGASSFNAIWMNNNVFGNSADYAGTSDRTGIEGNLKVDPLFYDAQGNDFRLQPGSPVIDAGSGDGLSIPSVDFTGQPRVQDGNADGTATVDIGAFEASSPNYLANISTRASVQAGSGVMIGGFVISGSAPKTVLVRAIGPSLVNYGVGNALPNPMLQLVRASDQTVIATNDDWQGAANAAQIVESGFAPSNSLESAILIALQPGAYTVIVSGAGGSSGAGLFEVYEAGHSEERLINVSTRGLVQPSDPMIGGFVIGGSSPLTVVVRAVGPSLESHGVQGALPNPRLQLVRMADQAVIAENDDWVSAPNVVEIASSGFAPGSSLESAIHVTLPPGAYTAIVSSVRGSGVALVEVYASP